MMPNEDSTSVSEDKLLPINLSFTRSLVIFSGCLLIILYILGFLVGPSDLVTLANVTDVLLAASPTIPVLFLFSLAIPNLTSLLKKEDFGVAVTVALFVTTAVLLLASIAVGLSEESDLAENFGFWVVPSLIATVIAFGFLKFKFLLRLIIAALIGLLVHPYTGFLVVFAYSIKFGTNKGGDLLSSDTLVPSAGFGLQDTFLLIILAAVIFLGRTKGSRTLSVVLNLIFVVLTFVYIFLITPSLV